MPPEPPFWLTPYFLPISLAIIKLGLWTKPQLTQRMKWNERILWLCWRLTLIYYLGGGVRGGLRGTHNSLQKLWKGQEAIGQAGHFRWLWLPDLDQVKVKHQLHVHLPNGPIRQWGRGSWVGHRRTDTVSKGQKAHFTLHPAHSYHVSQGAPAHLTTGYW